MEQSPRLYSVIIPTLALLRVSRASVPPVGEVLVLRLSDAPMTGSPDLAPLPPLPHPSQIGAGFRRAHPRSSWIGVDFSDFTQIGVG
jgi:hypothetical protein